MHDGFFFAWERSDPAPDLPVWSLRPHDGIPRELVIRLKYGAEARKVLEALLDKYASDGITQLENRTVLRLDPFRQMGSPANIARFFGGNQQYFTAVKELETLIYSIA